MAFTLSKKTDPLKWPVVVSVPTDGGEFQKFEFIGHFFRLSPQERDDILRSHRERLDSAKDPADKILSDTFAKLLCGWSGVFDADDVAVEFSRETIEAILKSPDSVYFSNGIWTAHNEIIIGAPREKN